MPKTVLAGAYNKEVRSWEPFQHWDLPREFSGFESEYTAFRNSAAVFDLSFRGRLKVSGKDSTAFLQRLLSSDVKNLKPGEGNTGCFLTAAAKLQCVLDILKEESAIWLDCHESSAERVSELLEKFHFNEDLAIENMSSKFALTGVEGPKSWEILQSLFGKVPQIKNNLDHFVVKYNGHECRIVNQSLSGEPGFWVWLPMECGSPFFKGAQNAGGLLTGFSAVNAVRIEAGYPFFGIDMDEHTLQPELNRNEWASTAKGCYAGQEVIQRVRNFGHASKVLVHLSADMNESLSQARLVSDGKEAGWITSFAYNPVLKKTFALGYIGYSEFEAGKPAEIETQGKRFPVKIYLSSQRRLGS